MIKKCDKEKSKGFVFNEVQRFNRLNIYHPIKRSLDFGFSLALLTMLSPVLLPVAIILKFTGEGDIWYFQKRIGYKNGNFLIWKFATMLRNSPNMLTGSLTLRNDPRVTFVGKYLRATKINEVPQLINVIKGEMALVGPRPQMEVDFLAFPDHIQKRIYNVPPGITGIGSILFRDEEKMISEAEINPRDFYNEVIAPYKGEVEIWYQENASVWLDTKILLITVLVVFLPHLKVSHLFKNLPVAPDRLRDLL